MVVDREQKVAKRRSRRLMEVEDGGGLREREAGGAEEEQSVPEAEEARTRKRQGWVVQTKTKSGREAFEETGREGELLLVVAHRRFLASREREAKDLVLCIRKIVERGSLRREGGVQLCERDERKRMST